MIELLPGIGELDKDSLCYSIYSQLYHNFFLRAGCRDSHRRRPDIHPFAQYGI